MRKPCKCKCGELAKEGNTFVFNHHRRGAKATLKTRKRISKARMGNTNAKGFHHTEETKKRMSETRKGRRHTLKSRRKMSLAAKGRKFTEKHKRNISKNHANVSGKNNPFYDKKHALKTKNKISKSKKGKCGGKNHPLWGKSHSKKAKLKMSKAHKKVWQNPDYVKKMIRRWHTKPNKPEKFLSRLLNKLYPKEFKFVGDGKVILSGFCPDFINVNGKKLIIEHNGIYWHNRLGSKEKDERKEKTYKDLGYKTLWVWQDELKDIDKLKNKIQEFVQ